jgi:hypothetical protein
MTDIIHLSQPERLAHTNTVLSHSDEDSDTLQIVQTTSTTLTVISKQNVLKIFQLPAPICSTTVYRLHNSRHCVIVCLLCDGNLLRLSMRDSKKKNKKNKENNIDQNSNSSKRKRDEDEVPTKRKKTNHSSQLSLFEDFSTDDCLQSSLVQNFTTNEGNEEEDTIHVDVKSKMDRYLLLNIPIGGESATIAMTTISKSTDSAEDTLAVLVTNEDGSMLIVTGIEENKRKKKSTCSHSSVNVQVKLSHPTCLCSKYRYTLLTSSLLRNCKYCCVKHWYRD